MINAKGYILTVDDTRTNLERLQMPYDEALLHYQIGSHQGIDSVEQEQHLATAATIFERLGVNESYDL